MIYGKKVRLFPTQEQEKLLLESCGVARFSYNRSKAISERFYRLFGKGLPDKDLLTYFTRLKKRRSFAWLKDYSADIPKQAVKDYLKAKKSSFERYNHGFRVNFKSKYHHKQGFYADYTKTKIRHRAVFISMIGEIKTSRQLPKNKKLSNPRITYDGEHWFLSVGFHDDHSDVKPLSNEIIGVDLGLKDMFTCSNGMVCKNITKSKHYKDLLRKKKIAQRKVSNRFIKGQKAQSKRYQKAKKALRAILRKISNYTKNYIHQATNALVKAKPKAIVIETLSVKNMMKNKRLAPSFQKSNLGFIKHCIAYKSKKWGIRLIVASPKFPSSQICSCCGHRYDEQKQGKAWGLSIREWTCAYCHAHHDRDINASKNLANYGATIPPFGEC